MFKAKMTNMEVKKILIIRFSSFGDIVYCLPVGYNLKENYPEAKISWLTREEYKDLLVMDRYVDEPVIIKKTQSKQILGRLKEIFKVLKVIRKENFDLVFNLQGDLLSDIVTFLSKARLKFRVDKRNNFGFRPFKYYPLPKDDKRHLIQRYLSVLPLVGINDPQIKYSFSVPLKAQERVSSFFNKADLEQDDFIITLHIGTKIAIKRWSEEEFAKLALALVMRYDLKIVVVYGPEEISLARSFRKKCLSPQVLLSPLFGLSELAEILKRSNLFIGHDSGPLHLAVALGLPTISVFGPSDPKAAGPYLNANHRVVRKELECSPCFKGFKVRFSCPRKDNKCLKTLSWTEVFQSLVPFLDKDPKTVR